jgi:hypothetical protein
MLLEHMKVVNPVPSLHSVRTFGEPGYVHTPVQKRIQSAKFQPRATKMYFVGREGSRIYHMWDSATGKVHCSSSVTWAKHELVKLPQALSNELPHAPSNGLPQVIRNEIPHSQRYSIPLFEPALQLSPTPPYTPTNQDDQESGGGAARQPGGEEVMEDKSQLPELGSGFEFDGLAEGSSFDFDRSIDDNTDNSLQALADARASPPRPSPPVHYEAPRHLDISASIESRNILQGKRTRKPSYKHAVATALHNPHISATLARCFATAIAEAPAATKLELPLEPTSMKQARVHVYSKDWLVAEGEEYMSHDDNNTWDIVLILPAGIYALPTKWVYKYKFDDTGKLIRFKARLVVCGNRQNVDFWRETYAAVARSTTLKVLLALVAALDLECDQLDVVTAFLNGWLDKDEDIYIRLPDGRLAKLRKALYGLRRSPRLWYEELARFLASIGYKPLEADPCVFTNPSTGGILLTYVDDIVMITRTKDEMAALKKLIFGKFKCHDMGPISHYLGIRIRRDRSRRAIELSMESYIDKLASDYKRTGAVARHQPMDLQALKLKLRPKDDRAPLQLLQRYQSLIGKLLYPASQLRTDVAFHVGYLARAMSNPTEHHYQYALQIVDYLYTYKELVMTFEALPALSHLSIDVFSKASSLQDLGLCAYSDASFADAEDRKSTSGYLFKFAGGTICHKSCKQKLITTSTTEAEYVALTYAAKEATWLVRLLKQVGYLGNDVYPVKLYGDNEPSIQLVSAEGHHERTKHVDIYYHYIKDRVKEGYLSLQHVRTHDMAADGLTKPLDKHAHRRFLDQVGLRKPIIHSAITHVDGTVF